MTVTANADACVETRALRIIKIAQNLPKLWSCMLLRHSVYIIGLCLIFRCETQFGAFKETYEI